MDFDRCFQYMKYSNINITFKNYLFEQHLTKSVTTLYSDKIVRICTAGKRIYKVSVGTFYLLWSNDCAL